MTRLSRLQNFWLSLPAWVRGLALGLAVGWAEFASDAIAHSLDHLRWSRLHLVEDSFSGIIFFGIGLWTARSHDKAVKQRADMMADLNHHCRNALQAIVFTHASDPAVREASQRIVDTLERVDHEGKLG